MRRCSRHQKVSYATESDADAKRIELIRAGGYDPGMEVFPCTATGGWHLGHRAGWRSLGRLIEESGGESHASDA